ncbi:hypothetical protein KY385_00895, partial [Candidatus Parcubacteria bacterium]|nr:hypothetical protein [Candidatus Parcubacteria bacterium]
MKQTIRLIGQHPIIAIAVALLTAIIGFNVSLNLASNTSISSTVSAQSETTTVRYLSPSGSDTNDCLTAQTPCQTFQHGVDTFPAGTEARLLSGDYPGFT